MKRRELLRIGASLIGTAAVRGSAEATARFGEGSDNGDEALTLPLQFVAFADSDGSHSHHRDTAYIARLVASLNETFRPANVQFTWDTEDYLFVPNTVLNRNFDANNDELRLTDASRRPSGAGWSEHDTARGRLTRALGNRVVCYLAAGSDWRFDSAQGRWRYEESTTNWGSTLGETFLTGDYSAIIHEIGHYLGLPHTFSDGETRTIQLDAGSPEKFTAALINYVAKNKVSIERALDVFDNDARFGIHDTPPDPGQAFWNTVGKDAVSIPVSFPDGRSHTYTLQRFPLTPMSSSYISPLDRASSSLGAFTSDQCRLIRQNARKRLEEIARFEAVLTPEQRRTPRAEDCIPGPNLVQPEQKWTRIWAKGGEVSLQFLPGNTLQIDTTAATGDLASAGCFPVIERLEENAVYEISLELRSSVPLLVVLLVQAATPPHELAATGSADRPVGLTSNWRKVTMTFEARNVQRKGGTRLPWIMTGEKPGTTWVRNLEVRRVLASDALAHDAIGKALQQAAETARRTTQPQQLQQLQQPQVPLSASQLKIRSGELRIEGEVVSIAPGRFTVNTSRITTSNGKVTALTPPRRKTVTLPPNAIPPLEVRVGTRVFVIGADAGVGKPMRCRILRALK